jgi:hypothetical protein
MGTEALWVTLWRGGKAVAILCRSQSDRAIGHAAMGRIEKTVFVSYRRTDESWGLAVFQDLTQHGYEVFIDYDGIASGSFETAILENIRARAHFLVLLTPTALERCGDPKDWMRREIEAALDSKRNIVPLMLEGFEFGTPAIATQLTGKLAVLKEYNGLPIPAGFFSEAMGRLRNKFLNVPVDAVLHPASLSAQQAATEQKDKATMALGEARKQIAEQITTQEGLINQQLKWGASINGGLLTLLVVGGGLFKDSLRDASIGGTILVCLIAVFLSVIAALVCGRTIKNIVDARKQISYIREIYETKWRTKIEDELGLPRPFGLASETLAWQHDNIFRLMIGLWVIVIVVCVVAAVYHIASVSAFSPN